MYMIRLYVQLHNPAPQLTAEYLDAVVYLLSNDALQYPESILRYPYYVILAMPQNMR